jgi:hypothetical protein
MANMDVLLEEYLETLDSLLDAGDAGQTLRRKHLPHVKSGSLSALVRPELVARCRVEIALPPVLLLGYCHIAEVDFHSQRIYYKRILNQQEADASTGILFLQEAQTFVRPRWLAKLPVDLPKDCTVAQTRSADNGVTWKMLGTSACSMPTITRKSQFMELARVATVVYTD